MKLETLPISQLQLLESGQFFVRYLTDFNNLGINPADDQDFLILHDAIIAQYHCVKQL